MESGYLAGILAAVRGWSLGWRWSFLNDDLSRVQPRLTEIKNQVLNRRMPPWGAVKGFGDFRNEQALTQEEIEMISDWIDSDAPRGNNRSVLPSVPKFSKPATFKKPKDALEVRGTLTLVRPFILDGIYPESVAEGTNARIIARFADSHVEPLLWLYEYNQRFPHPFCLKAPRASGGNDNQWHSCQCPPDSPAW
jgi:hypothetical protein